MAGGVHVKLQRQGLVHLEEVMEPWRAGLGDEWNITAFGGDLGAAKKTAGDKVPR